MRVFVTGASGHLGSAVLPELLAAGHEVIGLARSNASAAAIEAAGAAVRRGDLNNPAGLAAAAAEVDGVIHLAYDHDGFKPGAAATAMVDAAALDLRNVTAMGEALAGSGKPFVITTGTLLLSFAGLDRPGTEDDVLPGGPRIDSENHVCGLANHGVRSSAVRLPPTVHSTLDTGGFLHGLVAAARANGAAVYVGDGAHRWPAVHTLDAARLYRLALEAAPAGSRLHPIGDEGVSQRTIAEAIAARLGVPTVSITPEEAPAKLGFLAALVQMDNPTSGAKTRALLGWEPTGPSLLEDLASDHYSGPSA